MSNENGMMIYINDRKILPRYCIATFLEETRAVINEKYTTSVIMEMFIFSDKLSSKTMRLLLDTIAKEKEAIAKIYG